MKRKLILLLLLFVPLFVFAYDFPVLESFLPEDKSEEYNPNLSGKEMIHYSLVFSGYNENTIEYADSMKKYESLVNLIKSKDYSGQNEVQVAEEVLNQLYENILVRYVEVQNNMPETILKGVYNCVTSNILYIACCKELGLDARAQKSPGHSFATVYFDDNLSVDVETTNPFGFNPGEKKEIPGSKDMSRYAVVKPGNYRNRIEISDKVMVGLIAGNICSILVKKDNYFPAVPLGVSRYELCKRENSYASQDVRNDLDIIACNYAKDLQQKKKNKECLEWMNLYMSTYEKTEHVQKTFDALTYNAIVSRVNSMDSAGGYEILEKERNNLGSETILELEEMLCESKWIEKINNAGMNGKFLEALKLCDKSLEELPGNKNMLKIRKNCASNYAITVHNEFADYINAGDSVNAKRVLEEGLKLVPDSSLLKKDLSGMQK